MMLHFYVVAGEGQFTCQKAVRDFCQNKGILSRIPGKTIDFPLKCTRFLRSDLPLGRRLASWDMYYL